MKRYAVFAGPYYYPAGGWDDFVGFIDALDEVATALPDHVVDWWHVVDLTLGHIVFDSYRGQVDPA
ncbi:hypothetical protein [Herbaspirillum sp. RV1423]|uniref:hypothetical protein n=1 Tax=Herbaspirillum sp. RV1423 TaxID=1443993 RepID=UPI0004B10242|nr:hypothetical protein [Herbaspirillum sp. RV1423]